MNHDGRHFSLAWLVVFLLLTFVSPMSIQIGTLDAVDAVTTIMNDAYRIGETGILVQPFYRATRDEVVQMMEKTQILTLSIDQDVVGCIKVHVVQDGVAEWGCLAVAQQDLRKGYGKLLVQAAEGHIKTILKCDVAQLELLAPSSWKHAHKERLRDWYQRMGYSLANENYDASTMRLPQGSLLGDRFELATDGDFTCYQRKL